jgi:hypothetical protein
VSPSSTAMLGEAQITQSPHDTITVQLIERGDLPAIVSISWPESPSIVDPKAFGDSAAALVKLFSAAHVALAAIKARRRLS